MDLEEVRLLGNLYCLDRKLNLEEKVKDVNISNGLAWILDNKKMYYIDSSTKEVSAFDYDFKTGKISNRPVIIKFAEDEGVPDGMNIDAQGKFWIAHFGGEQVSRWDP